MLKVLISAYACGPDMGSEPGMGWNWITNLANHCKIYAITEGEWRDNIERKIMELPQGKNISFFYNPVPDKVRKICWNQGDWRFYYYYRKWQKDVLHIANKIIKENQIDIIHQLNMVGYREPGYLWLIKDKPFVWGPIGGMANFPEAYLKGSNFGLKFFFMLKNNINRFQKKHGKRVKQALKRADIIISATPREKTEIKRYHNIESVLIPETGCFIKEKLKSNYIGYSKNGEFNIIWVGKFDYGKQLGIALRSISLVKSLSGINFHVVGRGNDKQERKFKTLAKELGIEKITIWHGYVTNSKVIELMEQSHLFLFTSVYETTSTVVLEALSCSLPVLCFNAYGFGYVVDNSVGEKIELSDPNRSVNDFADKIKYLYNNIDVLRKKSQNCLSRQLEFSWEKKAIQMAELYEESVLFKNT